MLLAGNSDSHLQDLRCRLRTSCARQHTRTVASCPKAGGWTRSRPRTERETGTSSTSSGPSTWSEEEEEKHLGNVKLAHHFFYQIYHIILFIFVFLGWQDPDPLLQLVHQLLCLLRPNLEHRQPRGLLPAHLRHQRPRGDTGLRRRALHHPQGCHALSTRTLASRQDSSTPNSFPYLLRRITTINHPPSSIKGALTK